MPNYRTVPFDILCAIAFRSNVYFCGVRFFKCLFLKPTYESHLYRITIVCGPIAHDAFAWGLFVHFYEANLYGCLLARGPWIKRRPKQKAITVLIKTFNLSDELLGPIYLSFICPALVCLFRACLYGVHLFRAGTSKNDSNYLFYRVLFVA